MQEKRTGISPRRTREEILEDMERVYLSMTQEKDELEHKLEENKEGLENLSKQLEWTDDRVTRLEERVEDVHQETTESIEKMEIKNQESHEGVVSKLEENNKSMRSMTRAVLFGFCIITVAVLVLFISLVTKI